MQTGLALIPSAAVGFLAPRIAAPLLVRLWPIRAIALSDGLALFALLLAALGATAGAALILVAAVMVVMFAFGLGQPALTTAVGNAVPTTVRGVALGVASLVFLVGGGIGSAVVGGFGDLLGIDWSLLLLAALPSAGVLLLLPTVRAAR